ncbi:hypothetical protein [Nocardioides sp. Kera G14]|uniref:hypothetical protein n=1 Tax=Nocardioides sp. Kera G14 TaxID=2884264 RepID=UPI001D12EEE5|nr:hypothetical protein [Nocardioides sp. Kera G14]UDY23123.1 hypothetical protein LH076_13790 [Nocardioides sp. Kera G14]
MIKKFVAAAAATAVLTTGGMALGAGEAHAAYGPPSPSPIQTPPKKPTIGHIKNLGNKSGKLSKAKKRKFIAQVKALRAAGLITKKRKNNLIRFIKSH